MKDYMKRGAKDVVHTDKNCPDCKKGKLVQYVWTLGCGGPACYEACDNPGCDRDEHISKDNC